MTLLGVTFLEYTKKVQERVMKGGEQKSPIG